MSSSRPLAQGEPDFVHDARAFCERATRTVGFRVMRAAMRCSAEEISQVAAKVYCVALPSSLSVRESPLKRYLGLFLAPISLVVRKSWRWKPEPRVDWQFDVDDGRYFAERFERTYDALPGARRVSPRVPGSLERPDSTLPADASVTPRAWWLLLAMPLAWPSIVLLGAREGFDLLRAFRGAWVSYAVWEGYFRRYPCRDFVTYSDDGNEPSRYLAFKQAGGKRMTVVQNGERAPQPVWALGMTDLYLMFGPYYERLVSRLGYTLRSTASVGSLALDRFYSLDPALPAVGGHDVLLFDSGALIPPAHSGMGPEAVAAEEALTRNVGEFARRHPELRVAYVLRPYGGDGEAVMRRVAADIAGSDLQVLTNTGSGESYAAARQATVSVTFQSTMGYEAFLLGSTTLFVNYSGHADQTLCDDERYQIDTLDTDYLSFERKVLGLLGEPDDEPPAVALDHICCFDGRTQERVAEALMAR